MDLPIFYDNNGSHRDSCLEDVYRSLVSVANLPTNLHCLILLFLKQSSDYRLCLHCIQQLENDMSLPFYDDCRYLQGPNQQE